jgi:hypothetical protein
MRVKFIHEDNRTFGRERHRWESNVEMDLKEVGWQVVG